MEDTKITVAVIYGGKSGEHAISCATAAGIMQALDKDKYEIISIAITKAGVWVPGETDPQKLVLTADASYEVPASEQQILLMRNAMGNGVFVCTDINGNITQIPKVDVVFPVLHGPYGEDGTVQGILELNTLPFVGSGVLASALGMDKHLSKVVVQQAGVRVAPWVFINDFVWEAERQQALAAVEQLDYPVFVKPARAGSSLGVSKVEDFSQVTQAIEKARQYDHRILVESGIAGSEVEVAVLQSKQVDMLPRAASPGRLAFEADLEFYDFDTKYLAQVPMHLEIPAALEQAVLTQLQQQAVQIFSALGCEGLARVDFFVTDDNQIIFNEINTMPGFTPYSMYPKAWEQAGIKYSDLLDEIIMLAINKPKHLH